MGNAQIYGPKPNVKSPEVAKCSTSDPYYGDGTSDALTKKLKAGDGYRRLDEFCAEDGQTAFLGKEVCDNYGDPGEWKLYETEVDTGCQFNDCDPGYSVSNNGCNGGCCSIIGKSVSCSRQDYLGKDVTCCFNDYACQNDLDKCFQTPERQRTCPPENRDLTSTTCLDVIEPYCKGERLFASQTDWLEMWLENSSVEINSDQALSNTIYPSSEFSSQVVVSERGKKYPLGEKQPCLRAIARNVTLGNICTWDDLQEGSVVTTNINPAGINWSKNLLEHVYEKYQAESGGPGSLLNGISTDGLNRDSGFYNTLWNICNKIPLLCSNGSDSNAEGILPKMCKDITVEDIIKTPETLKWCACHMPSEQYAEYTNRYGITKECTPICNRMGVIPVTDLNGERKFCQQNTCIIDDNVIDLVNSEISGGVNFTQLCSGCGKINVNRTYTKQRGGDDETGSGNIDSFVLKNPQKPVFLTNYYGQVYDGYYSRENFPNNNLFLEVLYLPESFLIKYSSILKTKDSYIDITPPIITQLDLGTTLEKYLETNYGVFSVTVVFGLQNKTNCIGYINAGFKNNTAEKFKTTLGKDGAWRPLYLSTPDSDGTYKALKFQDQACKNPDTSRPGFYKVSNNVYNETIVSETSNSFSSGQVDGKVTANTCTCIMSGYNLESANAKINGSINFLEECGRSKCYDKNRNIISCASGSKNPAAIPPVEKIEMETAIAEEEEKYSTVFYILSSFLVLIFILIIFFELRK